MPPARLVAFDGGGRSRARSRSIFATHRRASALLVPGGNSKTSDRSNGFLNRTGGPADAADGGAAGAAEPEVWSATAGADSAWDVGRCAAPPRAIITAATPTAATAAAIPTTPVMRPSGHLSAGGGAWPAYELSCAEAGSAETGFVRTSGAAVRLSANGRDNASRSLVLNCNSMVSSSGSSANCGEPASNAFVMGLRYQGPLGATREFITFLARDSVATAHNAPENNRWRHEMESAGQSKL